MRLLPDLTQDGQSKCSEACEAVVCREMEPQCLTRSICDTLIQYTEHRMLCLRPFIYRTFSETWMSLRILTESPLVLLRFPLDFVACIWRYHYGKCKLVSSPHIFKYYFGLTIKQPCWGTVNDILNIDHKCFLDFR